MVSVDYQLARAFTAQSKWADPKRIRGGLADLTADDIRAAVSMATTRETFYPLMAKWCDDRYSERRVYDELEVQSWLLFGDSHPETQISRAENRKVVESALLFFLDPEKGRARGDAGHAAFMGVHRNTWSSKYKTHFRKLTALLFEREQRALAQIRAILRHDGQLTEAQRETEAQRDRAAAPAAVSAGTIPAGEGSYRTTRGRKHDQDSSDW